MGQKHVSAGSRLVGPVFLDVARVLRSLSCSSQELNMRASKSILGFFLEADQLTGTYFCNFSRFEQELLMMKRRFYTTASIADESLGEIIMDEISLEENPSTYSY